MAKQFTQAAAKQMALANTFQPQAGRILNAKTKTYRPVGAVQVTQVVPPLISGAARPVPPAPSSASAQSGKK